jgi:dihydrodipicolinate synthase/N-acetylneuraminate lyase
VPELSVELYQHARAGRHDDALGLGRRLTPLAQLVTTGFGVAGLKYALELRGYAGGGVRLPLQPLGPSAREEIAAALQALAPDR